jgi:hypothetical protein
MMMKRAQAAMEFLMTYGWAILVVLVVIGALAYFGVLNPQNLLPDRCEMQQGFYCKDYRLSDGAVDTVSFTFQNGRGTGMMVLQVNASGVGDLANVWCNTTQGLSLGQWAGKPGLHIENGASAQVVATCTANGLNGLTGSGKKKFDLKVMWYDAAMDATYNHTMQGQLLAGVETQ